MQESTPLTTGEDITIKRGKSTGYVVDGITVDIVANGHTIATCHGAIHVTVEDGHVVVDVDTPIAEILEAAAGELRKDAAYKVERRARRRPHDAMPDGHPHSNGECVPA